MEQAALVAVMIASVYMMLLTAFAYDDKYKIDGMLASLPIKREMLVMVRYLEVPILSIVAVLLYMLATALMAPWMPGLFPTQLLLPAAGFLAASIMSGLYMPIIYRFGYVKARIFNMVIFMLFFAVIPLAGFLGGNPEWGIHIPVWLATASEGMMAVLMIAAAAVILVVSCFLSIRLYRKREF
jgi:ABC-2 type transport system permease protein